MTYLSIILFIPYAYLIGSNWEIVSYWFFVTGIILFLSGGIIGFIIVFGEFSKIITLIAHILTPFLLLFITLLICMTCNIRLDISIVEITFALSAMPFYAGYFLGYKFPFILWQRSHEKNHDIWAVYSVIFKIIIPFLIIPPFVKYIIFRIGISRGYVFWVLFVLVIMLLLIKYIKDRKDKHDIFAHRHL